MTGKKETTMVLVNKDRIKLGACVHYPVLNGWKFVPNTTSRKSSRKAWPTCVECIPAWAFDASDEMLTSKEYEAEMRG